MEVKIEPGWKGLLQSEFNQPYFKMIAEEVKKEYQNEKCFPPAKEIFAAFDLCPLEETKVIIIGQDPYHGDGQANGLCFSVREGIPHPPSLVNIFMEMKDDLGNAPKSSDLSVWAKEGVLLLNSVLTVRRGLAGSHKHLQWERFTNAVIQLLSLKKEQLVFLLWGGYAKGKKPLIDTHKHLVLTTGHPSPLSANKGLWFGNKHFSQANRYLKEKGLNEIKWF